MRLAVLFSSLLIAGNAFAAGSWTIKRMHYTGTGDYGIKYQTATVNYRLQITFEKPEPGWYIQPDTVYLDKKTGGQTLCNFSLSGNKIYLTKSEQFSNQDHSGQLGYFQTSGGWNALSIISQHGIEAIGTIRDDAQEIVYEDLETASLDEYNAWNPSPVAFTAYCTATIEGQNYRTKTKKFLGMINYANNTPWLLTCKMDAAPLHVRATAAPPINRNARTLAQAQSTYESDDMLPNPVCTVSFGARVMSSSTVGWTKIMETAEAIWYTATLKGVASDNGAWNELDSYGSLGVTDKAGASDTNRPVVKPDADGNPHVDTGNGNNKSGGSGADVNVSPSASDGSGGVGGIGGITNDKILPEIPVVHTNITVNPDTGIAQTNFINDSNGLDADAIARAVSAGIKDALGDASTLPDIPSFGGGISNGVPNVDYDAMFQDLTNGITANFYNATNDINQAEGTMLGLFNAIVGSLRNVFLPPVIGQDRVWPLEFHLGKWGGDFAFSITVPEWITTFRLFEDACLLFILIIWCVRAWCGDGGA